MILKNVRPTWAVLHALSYKLTWCIYRIIHQSVEHTIVEQHKFILNALEYSEHITVLHVTSSKVLWNFLQSIVQRKTRQPDSMDEQERQNQNGNKITKRWNASVDANNWQTTDNLGESNTINSTIEIRFQLNFTCDSNLMTTLSFPFQLFYLVLVVFFFWSKTREKELCVASFASINDRIASRKPSATRNNHYSAICSHYMRMLSEWVSAGVFCMRGKIDKK